jgi:hypothetical protein
VLEIFPHRITPKTPHSLEDIILSIVAQSCIYYPNSRPDYAKFRSHELNGWIFAHAHPDTDLVKGCLYAHDGDATDSVVISCDQDTITLPDGRQFQAALFVPRTKYEYANLSRYQNAAMQVFSPSLASPGPESLERDTEDYLFYSVALGALSLYLGSGYHARFDRVPGAHTICPKDMVGAVCARANRLLKNRYSGQVAMDKGLENGKEFVSNLEQCWALRPDRGWMPRTWEAGPVLKNLMDKANERAFKAGQSLGQCALELNLGGREAIDDMGSSAHRALAIMEARDTLDDGLLHHCDPDWLMPRASAKARKLQAQRPS